MSYALTEKQRKFAEHFAEHGSQREAYRFAYAVEVKDAIACERGRRQMRNAAVRDLIEQLRGTPLPPARNVRNPRAYVTTQTTVAETNRETSEAMKALAVVAMSPAIPQAHRLASVGLLQTFVAKIAAELRSTPSRPHGGNAWELPKDANGATIVGNGAGLENSAGAGGRH